MNETELMEAKAAGVNVALFRVKSPPPSAPDIKPDTWGDGDWDLPEKPPPVEMSPQNLSPPTAPQQPTPSPSPPTTTPTPPQQPPPAQTPPAQTPPAPTPPAPTPPTPEIKIKIKLDDIGRKYNLRPKKKNKLIITQRKRVKYQANLPKWIPRTKNDFRDPILTEVETQTYHSNIKCDHAEKVISIGSICTKSQLDSFIYSSKKFIAMSWLTVMRIFEYRPYENIYLEVKRIPKRYISLSPQLITSIHCDVKLNFYIAYLWGSLAEGSDSERPYVEIRDINGDMLIDKPFYYDDVIREIYSDRLYIYVRLISNVIYLHRRNFFSTVFYRIDFTNFALDLIENSITSTRVVKTNSDAYRKLVLLTATASQLLVTRFNVFGHELISRYIFPEYPDFRLVSIDKYQGDFIIHRNTTSIKNNLVEECLSKVDIGCINTERKSDPFEPHISLTLYYYILQVSVHKDYLYLFGYRLNPEGIKFFEIGCLSIKALDPKPIWTTYLNGVDTNTQILVHSDNIAIIKNNQQVSSISTVSRERIECSCCKLSYLKKEDELIHRRTSQSKNIFGHRFAWIKTQVPPKIGKRQSLD